MNKPKILVVTSCTGKKKFKLDKQLILTDFYNPKVLNKKEKQLKKYACCATQMYTGLQHLRLVEGVKILRNILGEKVIDLVIISAGYGLIHEYDTIVPYSVTFNKMKVEEINNHASFLNIHDDLERLIPNYNLVFFLLGENYLRSLQFPFKTDREKILFFLASQKSLNLIPDLSAQSYLVPLSNAEAKKYQYSLIGLKGLLFKKFAEVVAKKPDLINKFIKNPTIFTDIIEPNNQQLTLDLEEEKKLPISSRKTQVININRANKLKIKVHSRSESNSIINLPDEQPAKNKHYSIKYFIPEWDDYVDPDYDFLANTHSQNRIPYKDDVYAHEIYKQPCYDGILISRTIFEKNRSKREKILADGIHKYIRFRGDIIGDCGAFSYINEEVPIYTTEEVLDYYQTIGVNYGVSVDHLIVGGFAKNPEIRNKRYQITIDNAQEFIKQHSQKNYDFVPIGAVQGWDIESYVNAVKDYISMGYKYIGLGGFARSKTEDILPVLAAIKPYLTEETRLHLFGVGRLNAVPIFRHLGVTSFDSASPLRKAWLDRKANYHAMDGKTYSAIRVSKSISTKIITGIAEQNLREKVFLEDKKNRLKQLGDKALKSVRRYAENKMDLDDVLKDIIKFDELAIEFDLLNRLAKKFKKLKAEKSSMNEDDFNSQFQILFNQLESINSLVKKEINKHTIMYQKVLEDKPWTKCDCPICQEIGVEVVIFKGNNRNRRRGFHNTYTFYQRFKDLIK